MSTRQPAVELGRGRGIEGHRKMSDFTVIVSAADFAVPIKPRDGGSVAQWHSHLACCSLAVEERLDGLQELADAFPAQRRYRELTCPLRPGRGSGLQDAPLLHRKCVDLVQRLDRGRASAVFDCAKLSQDFLDVGTLRSEERRVGK